MMKYPKSSTKHMTRYIDSLYWLSFGWRLIWREKSWKITIALLGIVDFEKVQSFTRPASNLIKICLMCSMWIFGPVWLATVSAALVVEPDHMAMAEAASPDCGGCFQHLSTLKHWSHWSHWSQNLAPSKIGNKIGWYWLFGLNRWLVASWYLSSGWFKEIQSKPDSSSWTLKPPQKQKNIWNLQKLS